MKHLGELADVNLCQLRYLPLTNRFSPFKQLPIGIGNHLPGSIVHFPQIMGCAMRLYRPYHPSVATIHDLGVLVCKKDQELSNWLDRRLLDINLAGLKLMDHWIADSEFTARGLVDILRIPRERIEVIYLGVDTDWFRPLAQARAQISERYKLSLTSGTSYLLYVGNEQPRKNLCVLLSALAKLKREGHRVQLIKVGGAGGERWRQRFLAEVQQRQLGRDIMLVGYIPEADLPLFYNSADLFVTSSLIEGFGLPALEALACGTPVICSHAGSLPEIVGDAAFLIDPRDSDSFASTIALVLDDPLRRQEMSERGLAQAAKFTWDKTVEQMIRVYRSF
ncbi:MAG: glycosyltransferase family 4 protein [Anaerolineales bacterium]|nr:glycosyltransferase family 4 protein [Anaerolineales bacterium]